MPAGQEFAPELVPLVRKRTAFLAVLGGKEVVADYLSVNLVL